MRSNLLIVAKEGILYVLLSTSLLLLSLLFDLDFFSFLFLLTTLLFVYIFINPEREPIHFDEKSIVAPSDAKVIAIKELKGEEYALKVDLKTSYTDVSILRVPMGAQVENIFHYNGTRVSSTSKLFLDTNEYTEILFRDKNANTIKVVHRLEQSFKGLDINLIVGKTVVESSRYGVMVSGVTTIYFPKNFRLSTHLGVNLKAGKSLMGYFS